MCPLTSRLLSYALLSLAVLLPASSLCAEVTQPSVRDLATKCESIFIGKVLDSTCERNVQGSILTRTTFEVLHSVTAPQSVGSLVDLVQLGGELDGQQLRVSERTHFDLGATYLVFAEDSQRVVIPATLGGVHGCMRIVRGSDNELYPLMRGYRPISGAPGGKFDYARRALSISKGVAMLDSSEEMHAAPIETTPGFVAITAVENTTAPAMRLTEVLALIHAKRGEAPLHLPKFRGMFGVPNFSMGGGLCSCGFHDLNVVYQQVYSSWTSYDHNEWSMARWNYYVYMHRYIDTDGTWNAPNSTNEICGWTSSTTLTNIYGAGKGWGANTLAVNFGWSGSGCDEISENDIHFNPAFSWAYSLEDTLGLGGPILYAPIMMHEMGHSIALETGSCSPETYTYDRPTVMVGGNRNIVEDGKGIHRRDAREIRAIYDAQVSIPSLEDMGVETWWMNSTFQISTVSPTTIKQGENLTLNDVFVENMSTSSVSDVRVRVFLSTNMTISENDYQIGGYTYWTTFGFDADWRGQLFRTIPYDVPPDTYYVGVIVTSTGNDYDWDDYSGNNATFYPTPITVNEGDNPPAGDSTPFQIALAYNLRARFFADTTGATPDPDPPYCPGGGTMGPSIFIILTAAEDGMLEIARADESSNESFLATDMVAAYTANAGGTANQLLGLACNTSTAENVLSVAVTAGSRYILRIGGIGETPVVAPYAISIKPTKPWGSVPELARQWANEEPLNNSSMWTNSIPLPCVQGSARGMWFRWTAPAAGTLAASTCDAATTFPNVVSIHTPLPFTSVLACGEDHFGCAAEFGTTATTQVFAGQQVLIRVASTTQLTGDFKLNAKFTASNAAPQDCSNALSIASGLTPFSTYGRGPDSAPICDPLSAGSRSVWFKFTLSNASTVRVGVDEESESMNGLPQSEEVSVTAFTATNGYCSQLLPVACNNLGGSNGGVRVNALPNAIYYIRIASRTGLAPGAPIAGMLRMSVEPMCVGDFDHDGSISGADLTVVLNAWGTAGPMGDLNGDNIVDASDIALILNLWGPCS